MAETAWNELGMVIDGVEYASFSTDNRGWIARIRKLIRENPGTIIVKAEPEENDGCLYCWIPKRWFRIAKPKTLNLTEEERRERAERINRVRKSGNDSDSQVSWEPNGQKLPFTDLDDEDSIYDERTDFEIKDY